MYCTNWLCVFCVSVHCSAGEGLFSATPEGGAGSQDRRAPQQRESFTFSGHRRFQLSYWTPGDADMIGPTGVERPIGFEVCLPQFSLKPVSCGKYRNIWVHLTHSIEYCHPPSVLPDGLTF